MTEDERSNVRVEVLNDDDENFRKRAADSLLIRAGWKPSEVTPGAEEFAGYSLKELARECLRQKGIKVPVNNLTEPVSRALSSTDFPFLLTETARQSLVKGFQEEKETYSQWTGEMSVPDFKSRIIDVDVDIDNDNEMYDFNKFEEYRSIKMGKPVEAKISPYCWEFQISRQSIINDELFFLTTKPSMEGAKVKNKIADVVYDIFKPSAPLMDDGKSLFHPDHNNISALGANGNPTVDKISAARHLLIFQTNQTGRRLNIQPRVYLFPDNLYAAAETFFKSDKLGSPSGSNAPNIYFNSLFRVYEPRLDDISPNTFYLVGPKDMGVMVVYLAGNKTPFLESRKDFKTDGLDLKVRFDFGVKAVSWRAMVKATTALEEII
ncbi:MAG: hypothetical protein LBT86_09515 [Deltaproteobacteria bacterium]|jgi:hypothetical protein|nr:hypothetical protein [Deltaproteobacteria bacterium]